MIKWIAAGCLGILVIVGIVAYFGYRQVSAIAAAGPSVTVSIKASPERVFASMTHSDSLETWSMPGFRRWTTRRGVVAAGDTIFLAGPRDSVATTAIVIDSIAPGLIVQHWVALGKRPMTIERRRDSIYAVGDSTMVTATIESGVAAILDSARGRSGSVSSGLIDMSSTLSAAGSKMQAEQQLRVLKHRIEGPPVVRP